MERSSSAQEPTCLPAESRSLGKNLVNDRRIACSAQVRKYTENRMWLNFIGLKFGLGSASKPIVCSHCYSVPYMKIPANNQVILLNHYPLVHRTNVIWHSHVQQAKNSVSDYRTSVSATSAAGHWAWWWQHFIQLFIAMSLHCRWCRSYEVGVYFFCFHFKLLYLHMRSLSSDSVRKKYNAYLQLSHCGHCKQTAHCEEQSPDSLIMVVIWACMNEILKKTHQWLSPLLSMMYAG